MTKYLFKLARRLASALVAASMVGLSACSDPASRDFLGPDSGTPTNPSSLASLRIASHAGSINFDDYHQFAAWGRTVAGDSVAVAVSWTTTGGQISSSGLFHGTASGTFTVKAFALAQPSLSVTTTITVGEGGSLFTGLRILPEPVTIGGGMSVAFAATAKLVSNGATTAPAVTWTTNGGTISAGGQFTASMAPGTYQVTATTLDGKLTGTAAVVIQEAWLTALELSPKVVILPSGSSQVFQVNATWSDGSSYVPELEWQTAAGTVVPLSAEGVPQNGPGNGNGGGQLNAGASPGNYRVIAKEPKSGKSDTAYVTVAPALAELSISPVSTELVPGAIKGFTVTGRMTDGSTVSVAASWTASGGAVSGSGVYTAGTQAGSFRVIARTTDGALADTALVNISQPQATLQGLSVSPASGLVPVGGIVQFEASAVWSDGSTPLPPVIWSASGGSISQEGRWTAPTSTGTYRVIVRNMTGTLADTAAMSVVVPPPSVATLKIAPKTASAIGGQSLVFSASATWTDGSTTLPPLQWSATGGHMAQNGTWEAPSVAGTFKVVVKHVGGTLADTASVSVTTAPRVTAIKLSPGLAATSTGKTVQFTAAATWNDGVTRPVTFIWTATGGIINASGLYAAGSLVGQFLVAATCTGCAVTDTVAVTLIESESTSAPATLTSLVLNPSSMTVNPGEQRTLNPAATWSDGSTTLPPLTWDASGGTLSGIVYTAGSTAGSYRIIVRHQDGAKADTTAVTVLAGDPLVSLSVSPDSTSVPSGFSVSFAVSGKTASGATVTPPVTWSGTGGSITAAGVYTAGLASGTYRVIAKCVGCALADTAVVVVGTPNAPPPPTGSVGDLVVFPNAEIEFIIGPQLKSGAASNPWPWFDQNATEKGLQFGSAFPANPTLESNRDNYLNRNYYDLGLALYTEYYRTGNPTLLAHARKVTDSWWMLPNAGQGTNTNWDNSFSPRSSSLGGLMLRALDGRPEMWPWITGYTRYMLNIYVSRWIGQDYIRGARDGGYMLLYGAMLARVHPDPAVQAEFTAKVRAAGVNYYAANQYPDGSWRWDDSYQSTMTGKFMQPFMVGLLLEGMVAAHIVTGEPAILSAITKSVENIYAVAYRKDEAVPERPDVSWRGMWYFMYGNECNPATAPKCGTSNLAGGWDTNSIRGVRQMNPHLIHAFGYAYAKTGDPRYRNWGDEIFAATFGKGQGPLTDAYYSLADFREKEYNAAYRSSGRYLAWRLGM
jgi:hypothetical protein